MSMQLQSTSTVLSVSLEKPEPLTVIKNEPPESSTLEIGIDNILNSSDQESIPDIKDIDIVSHVLSEGLIKNEPVPENIFENNHSESVETQVLVKTENIPLIKTENISQSEYLYRMENTSDGEVSRGISQGVIEVRGSNEHFKALQSDKQFVNFFKVLSDVSRKAKCPNKTDFSECYTTVETTSCKKDKEKGKVIQVPVVSYCCAKCSFATRHPAEFKLHELSHKAKAGMVSRYLKYHCDECDFKTNKRYGLNRHKLSHLKPEEIQYFYCYHCSYKCTRKDQLKAHIFRHFKNEEIKFHCYICNFMTPNRELITEHINNKKHEKRYCCAKCAFVTRQYAEFKLHELSHKRYAEMHDRRLKHSCDKCNYKTNKQSTLDRHKLNHLKLEEIQYLYCFHCSYKSKRKDHLKIHVVRHFEKEEITFHCYICDFMTPKRELIIDHITKHSNVQIKSEISKGIF